MAYRIAVIGAGQMGSGIAQVAAQSGHTVLLNDRETEYIQRGIASIDKNLKRSVEKGKITDDAREQTLARIHAHPAAAKFDVDI
ncbi:MAG TPA: 3-hydroxyacyl-CoA dehydrogenase NAD-binding domain-containing protein, partial [Candidatus Baltobacteraceae bacterium]|nr:3-hydroxyacyl-CoA dehydrogenase NAD-binding domain-containing protein [Candidatus Baltobacteraceae bacterium]